MSAVFVSINPASGETVWQGGAASADDCAGAIAAARRAFPAWAARPADARIAILQRYADVLGERRATLAEAIARETGKPLWEAQTEVASMSGKVAISGNAMA